MTNHGPCILSLPLVNCRDILYWTTCRSSCRVFHINKRIRTFGFSDPILPTIQMRQSRLLIKSWGPNVSHRWRWFCWDLLQLVEWSNDLLSELNFVKEKVISCARWRIEVCGVSVSLLLTSVIFCFERLERAGWFILKTQSVL